VLVVLAVVPVLVAVLEDDVVEDAVDVPTAWVNACSKLANSVRPCWTPLALPSPLPSPVLGCWDLPKIAVRPLEVPLEIALVDIMLSVRPAR
jgi:hypothetical protein